MDNNWIEKNNALEKTFRFISFTEAIHWMLRASIEIEKINHHPEWTNVYNKVLVRITTHDSGSTITEKDYQLAEILDKV